MPKDLAWQSKRPHCKQMKHNNSSRIASVVSLISCNAWLRQKLLTGRPRTRRILQSALNEDARATCARGPFRWLFPQISRAHFFFFPLSYASVYCELAFCAASETREYSSVPRVSPHMAILPGVRCIYLARVVFLSTREGEKKMGKICANYCVMKNKRWRKVRFHGRIASNWIGGKLSFRDMCIVLCDWQFTRLRCFLDSLALCVWLCLHLDDGYEISVVSNLECDF